MWQDGLRAAGKGKTTRKGDGEGAGSRCGLDTHGRDCQPEPLQGPVHKHYPGLAHCSMSMGVLHV